MVKLKSLLYPSHIPEDLPESEWLEADPMRTLQLYMSVDGSLSKKVDRVEAYVRAKNEFAKHNKGDLTRQQSKLLIEMAENAVLHLFNTQYECCLPTGTKWLRVAGNSLRKHVAKGCFFTDDPCTPEE
eukprot:5559155-Prymnesium_polylepis.1